MVDDRVFIGDIAEKRRLYPGLAVQKWLSHLIGKRNGRSLFLDKKAGFSLAKPVDLKCIGGRPEDVAGQRNGVAVSSGVCIIEVKILAILDTGKKLTYLIGC